MGRSGRAGNRSRRVEGARVWRRAEYRRGVEDGRRKLHLHRGKRRRSPATSGSDRRVRLVPGHFHLLSLWSSFYSLCYTAGYFDSGRPVCLTYSISEHQRWHVMLMSARLLQLLLLVRYSRCRLHQIISSTCPSLFLPVLVVPVWERRHTCFRENDRCAAQQSSVLTIWLLMTQRVEQKRFLTHSTPAVPNCCGSKGSVPYWSNPPFLIFDIRTLWRSGLSARAPECQKLKMVC